MPRAPFAARLLRWYDAQRRDLPWRRTSDPWAIWVSEVMLQQTRVEAVRRSYERFIARYPTPTAFAAASDDELMTAWRGLGYYRRARLLRQAAQQVCDRHGGRVPSTADDLARLPGVGDYTRGAIASIAFGLELPAIDGNVERVAARHLLLQEPVDGASGRRAVRDAVGSWLDRARPGDFNQALMELGATVCTPTSPACARCPVAADCAGRAAGAAAGLPRKQPRPQPLAVAAHVLVAPVGRDVLALRIPTGEPNAGQWELPGPGILRDADASDVPALTEARCGVRFAVGAELARVRHAITRHRIALSAHAATPRGRGRGALQALPAHDPAVPWSTPSRKVFAALLRATETPA